MDILLINGELKERIKYWKLLSQMAEEADDWTKCPECREQLYWCHCPDRLAYEILSELTSEDEE